MWHKLVETYFRGRLLMNRITRMNPEAHLTIVDMESMMTETSKALRIAESESVTWDVANQQIDEAYAAGYREGRSTNTIEISVGELTALVTFANNVNNLLAGLLTSPLVQMMAKSNPQAQAAIDALQGKAS